VKEPVEYNRRKAVSRAVARRNEHVRNAAVQVNPGGNKAASYRKGMTICPACFRSHIGSTAEAQRQ